SSSMRACSPALTASKNARISSSERWAVGVLWNPSRLVTAVLLVAMTVSSFRNVVWLPSKAEEAGPVQDLYPARAIACLDRPRAASAALLLGRRRGTSLRPSRRAPLHLPAVAEQPDPQARADG